MKSQGFYWDSDKNEFYYVNFQESTYFKITRENEVLYEFFRNIYNERWHNAPKEIIQTFKEVDSITNICG